MVHFWPKVVTFPSVSPIIFEVKYVMLDVVLLELTKKLMNFFLTILKLSLMRLETGEFKSKEIVVQKDTCKRLYSKRAIAAPIFRLLSTENVSFSRSFINDIHFRGLKNWKTVNVMDVFMFAAKFVYPFLAKCSITYCSDRRIQCRCLLNRGK